MKRRHKSTLETIFDSEVTSASEWCTGRYWQGRLALLLGMGYVGVRHLQDPAFQSIFKGLNLGLHEFGHYLFAPLGEFVQVAGGSLFQCLVPIIAIVMFRQQKDFFGIAIAWGWLSTNLFEVATYAADARAQELPLVSPGAASGGDIIHDWNFMLDRLGWLQYDHAIAQMLRFDAILSMFVCLVFGGWLCWMMFRSGR
jgi:hypothetical protein